MKFHIDKQTLNDLSIFDCYKEEKSIIGLFRPASLRGKEMLKWMFNNPLINVEAIRQRQSAIQYLQVDEEYLKIEKEDLDFIDHYLSRGNRPTKVSKYRAWEKGVWNYIKPTNEQYIIYRGVLDTLIQLNAVYEWAKSKQNYELPSLILDFTNTIISIIEHPDFSLVLSLKSKKKLGTSNIHYCDHLFRYLGFDRLMRILDIIYQMDVFQAVAIAAKEYGLHTPVFKDDSDTCIDMKGLWHPFLVNAVRNDVSISSDKNVCFVTGSNMAGKSTMLKSVGIAVFLAHVGFPVFAERMDLSLMSGLITTINISDDISKGYSHFYSEVQRVKEVCTIVSKTQRVLVIFDELFRGTNVKDAFDASRAIIEALTTVKHSLFFISTHIVEVAQDLESEECIDFKYMETTYEDNEPVFNFKLKSGITDERIGMWIIRKEGILDIIKGNAVLQK